jgi:hypothetical protein
VAQLLILAYIAIGGMIGSILASYIARTSDRRTARAAVVSKISEVESFVALQRQAGTPALDDDSLDRSHLDALLADLESISLTAGVPRAAVTTYASACQLYGSSESAELVALAADQRADYVLAADPSASDLHKEAKRYLGETVEALLTMRAAADRIQNAALELLGKAIWRPVRFSTAKYGLARLERAISELNSRQRQMEQTSGHIQDVLENTLAARPPDRSAVQGSARELAGPALRAPWHRPAPTS